MELENVHPGEILKKDFIDPIKIPLLILSRQSGIPVKRIFNLIEGKESITFYTAHRLSQVFGNSSDFWINAQKTYDYNESNRKKD